MKRKSKKSRESKKSEEKIQDREIIGVTTPDRHVEDSSR